MHLYILHPPGGVVGGDSIDIKVSAREGSRALATTPSATKFYRVDNGDLQQIQGCQLTSKQGAVLEWLPLETIVFRGASPRMTTDVHLEADGRFVGGRSLRSVERRRVSNSLTDLSGLIGTFTEMRVCCTEKI